MSPARSWIAEAMPTPTPVAASASTTADPILHLSPISNLRLIPIS
jgi:hypothetical protein